MPRSKWDNSISEALFKVILTLKSLSEAKKFFRDLLTEQEIIEFSKRWQAAQMLSKKTSYSKIEQATGLSSTTVARVSRWLNKGAGGYRLALKRIAHHGNSFSYRKRLS